MRRPFSASDMIGQSRRQPWGKLCEILHCQPGDLLEYVADEIPNAETIAAIKELDNGGGEHFTGSTEELFKKILSEPDEATGK